MPRMLQAFHELSKSAWTTPDGTLDRKKLLTPNLSVCMNADRARMQVIRSSVDNHAPPVVQSGYGNSSFGK
eukprot:3822344-Alexandrium_andersonii.AAC.1